MSKFEQRRQQVLTPALEGSKEIQPVNSLIPVGHNPYSQGGREPFGHRALTQGGREPFEGREPGPFTPGRGREPVGRPFTPGRGREPVGRPFTPGRGTEPVGHPFTPGRGREPVGQGRFTPFPGGGREPSGQRPFTPGGGREMLGPYHSGYYPGGVLPPLGHPYMHSMPVDRFQVPTIMPRPRIPYAGPPSLMPYWGGYSIGRQYFPEGKKEPKEQDSDRKIVQIPVRIPKKVPPPPPPPPIYNAPPPPLPTVPVPIIIRNQIPGTKRAPIFLPKKTVKKNSKKTFPGSEALRRFRHAALVVVFIAHLRASVKKNLTNRPSSTFLFGIILKEIVAALHRIYLNPHGNIYPVLNDIIGPNCYDLATLVHGGQMDQREESVLVQELQYVVENIIYHITEIMPSTGVLGCHRKSAVFELVRSGKRFPNGYFWQVEKDRLQFTEQGRTHNVSDSECFMLMLGIFISRSLVTTVLMKPLDYGLSAEPLSEIAERNLRIVASTILYLVRRISIQRGRGIMEMPTEISKYLYSDDEMQHVYSKLSRTFNYCEGLLREWGTEYIRRIRASVTRT